MVQESTMTPPVSKSHLWGVFQDQQKVTHFLETEAAFFFMLPRKLWPGFLLQDKQRKIIESQGTAGPGDVVWWLSTWLACTSTWVCSSAQKSKLKRNRTSCRAKRALKTGRELPSAELGTCCHFFPPSYFLTSVAHRRKSPCSPRAALTKNWKSHRSILSAPQMKRQKIEVRWSEMKQCYEASTCFC